MGEIGRAHDQVYAALPNVLRSSEEDTRLKDALTHLYQVGYRHGEADWAEEHRDDEPTWVTGARALKHAGGDDKAIGSYVRHFLDDGL